MEKCQADDIGLLNKRIHDALEKQANMELKQLDLTLQQLRVLRYIKGQGGSVSQKMIAEHLGVSGPTTAGILQRLEAKGFIVYSVSAHDKRSNIISITEKEDLLHQTMKHHREKTEVVLCKGFSEEEKKQLLSLLRRVYRNILEHSQEESALNETPPLVRDENKEGDKTC